MSIVRTVLGDIDAAELGVCGMHEHVVIDKCYATAAYPEFVLDSLEQIGHELEELEALGVGALVDAMPRGCGRNVQKLAELSGRWGIHIVASTGLHLRKYYDPCDVALDAMSQEKMIEEFYQEIDRSSPRCGIIKIAGSRGRLTDLERRSFIAAAVVQRRTGCPILTHTEGDDSGIDDQIATLGGAGADLSHVVLSHTDRCEDPQAHRQWLSTGVRLEYDQHFRWQRRGRSDNPTIKLLADLLPQFPTQIMVGMDAARNKYWKSYGGTPGLSYLVTTLRQQLSASGLSDQMLDRLYRRNPAQAMAFGNIKEKG